MNNEGPTSEIRHRAVLLLGPTGSGKTPLGEWMQERELRGARCLHFDFGANLREIVARNRPDELIGRQEIDFLREVLESGALLEDEHFPLAERILCRFMATRGADPQTWIVLNGLPRHAGQAMAVDSILDVKMVVHLNCTSQTVVARIRANAGGDRSDRTDDDPAAVGRKLAIFNRRTAPLLAHYGRRGAEIVTVEVTAGMTAGQIGEFAFFRES